MSIRERDDETTADRPSKASRVSMVLEPSAAQLSPLRSSVAEWLPPAAEQAGLAEDVLLVASEMGAVAIERCDGERPIVVNLRRTHSILVVEVICHLKEKGSLSDLGVPGEEGRIDLGLMERLADRVTAEVGGRVATLCGTFHLGPPAPG